MMVPSVESAPVNEPAALAQALGQLLPGQPGVYRLQRLTAGATQQTWAFDAVHGDGAALRQPGALGVLCGPMGQPMWQMRGGGLHRYA